MTDMPVHAEGRVLPEIRFREEDLPSVKNWKVNGKYYLIVKVEMVGKQSAKAVGADDYTDREKIEGQFQILNVKPLGDNPVSADILKRKDFENKIADVRSGKM